MSRLVSPASSVGLPFHLQQLCRSKRWELHKQQELLELIGRLGVTAARMLLSLSCNETLARFYVCEGSWGQCCSCFEVRKRFKREPVPNEHLRQVSPIVHSRKSLAGCPSICLRSRYEHGVGFGVAGLLRAVTRGVLWAFVDALVFTRRFSSPIRWRCCSVLTGGCRLRCAEGSS